VSLSNHPNYAKGFKGQFLAAEEMNNTVQGLEDNELLTHDIVLNGYTRNIDVLLTIRDTVQRLRKNNPNAIYICDPVLGDNGQFYVPEALLDVYKNHLIPLANVITPNYFEVEVLTGMKVKCLEDAVKASAMLHDLGATIVLMTGQRLSGATSYGDQDDSSPPLSILLSTRLGRAPATNSAHSAAETSGETDTKITDHAHYMLRIDVPQIPGYFHGCGDLLSALCANGIFRAISLSGGSMAAIIANADENIATFQKHLALMLDHSAWAMTNIVADTYHKGTKELHIIESAHIYLRIKEDWHQVSESGAALAGTGTEASPTKAFKSFLHREQLMTPAKSVSMTPRYLIQPAYSALGVGKERVQGVILDMDGTLTMPGLIDFGAMMERNGLSKLDGSILSQICAMDEEKRKAALDVILDEERKGNEKLQLRSELKEFLSVLLTKRVRMALATLNSELSVNHFLETAGIPPNTFHPAVNRDSLGGVMKPDPQVAVSILSAWDVQVSSITSSTNIGNYWFIGDSLDDMNCGHLAGCKTCLIRTKFNKQVELEHAETGLITVVVDTLTEWLEHVL